MSYLARDAMASWQYPLAPLVKILACSKYSNSVSQTESRKGANNEGDAKCCCPGRYLSTDADPSEISLGSFGYGLSSYIKHVQETLLKTTGFGTD